MECNFEKDFEKDSCGAYTYQEYLETKLELALEKIKQLELDIFSQDVCTIEHDWIKNSSGVHCSRCGRWWG